MSEIFCQTYIGNVRHIADVLIVYFLPVAILYTFSLKASMPPFHILYIYTHAQTFSYVCLQRINLPSSEVTLPLLYVNDQRARVQNGSKVRQPYQCTYIQYKLSQLCFSFKFNSNSSGNRGSTQYFISVCSVLKSLYTYEGISYEI